VAFATTTALCLLGRRVLALDAEKEHLDNLLAKLVEKTAPELLGLFGVGVDTASALGRHRRRLPRAHPLRGGLGTPVRGRSHRGLFKQDHALQAGAGAGTARPTPPCTSS